ncbi:MAG TPA: VOC family protein [Actinomycetota bacterium]|jgi:predicted enzyme related to lactoylglutathione lyase|nr:VOC family protein [Actinomycetota bacterium]
MNLNSILIGSEDPKGLAEYYTRLFGAPVWDDGGYVGWRLGSGFLTVGPHDQVKGRNASPGRILWNLETADVRGEFERMKAAGATVVQEPYTPEGMEDVGEGEIATFEDPDGNYFQLMSPMPMPEDQPQA